MSVNHLHFALSANTNIKKSQFITQLTVSIFLHCKYLGLFLQKVVHKDFLEKVTDHHFDFLSE